MARITIRGKKKGKKDAPKAFTASPEDVGVLEPGTPAVALLAVEMESGTVRPPVVIGDPVSADPAVHAVFIAPDRIEITVDEPTEFVDVPFEVTVEVE